MMKRLFFVCVVLSSSLACQSKGPQTQPPQSATSGAASDPSATGQPVVDRNESQIPGAENLPMAHDKPAELGTRMRCVVSKDRFTVKLPSPRSEHNFKHYVFCSEECKHAFDAAPKKYQVKSDD